MGSRCDRKDRFAPLADHSAFHCVKNGGQFCDYVSDSVTSRRAFLITLATIAKWVVHVTGQVGCDVCQLVW